MAFDGQALLEEGREMRSDRCACFGLYEWELFTGKPRRCSAPGLLGGPTASNGASFLLPPPRVSAVCGPGHARLPIANCSALAAMSRISSGISSRYIHVCAILL